MKDYLKLLNDVQREAVVQSDGPVMVIAGPGSGKTRVLTFRIAHLIENGVRPDHILALTFTNKAAREMKERITKVVGEKASKVWAGTFHSIFARILRMEAEKIGYTPQFTIYDSDDSKSIIGTIIKEMNLNKDVYNANAIRSRISSCKSSLLSPSKYLSDAEFIRQDKIQGKQAFGEIYLKYVERCKQAGAMDFDDLLYQMFILLHKNPDNVLEKYRQRFQYMLVDEFQDTNFLQYAIVKKLSDYPGSPQNICIVGDDAQSIYAFRGATIDNILEFGKDYPKLKVFKLEQNYRSTEHIVQAANELITFNKKQIQKKIWTDQGTGNKIKVVKTVSDAEEGKRVADLIIEYKNRLHIPNQEIAILYRTNAQSRVFEEYLRRGNLAYRIYGGQSFYQRKEVKDFIAYLRLCVNPRDEEALRRVINYPRRAIGNATIDGLAAYALANNLILWDTLTSTEAGPRASVALRQFRHLIESFGQKSKTANAFEVAQIVFVQSGLLAELRQDTTVEGISRLENVNALVDAIKSFVEDDETVYEEDNANDKSLSTYLQNIALISDQDQDSEQGKEQITLMSVHAAKGLEFDCVFVTGMEEQLFPSFMSLDDPNGLDEERRLFYVAITRARKILTLTYSSSRYKFGTLKYYAPSRFLEEISAEHLDSAVAINTRQPEHKPTVSVTGSFGKLRSSFSSTVKIDPATFVPSPNTQIAVGQDVLHLKFGKG
ncbi:MAG: UvrD-helicase domain-containing protein, partial [Saprospiraceae bacterium]